LKSKFLESDFEDFEILQSKSNFPFFPFFDRTTFQFSSAFSFLFDFSSHGPTEARWLSGPASLAAHPGLSSSS
jgi:hypothetical protein